MRLGQRVLTLIKIIVVLLVLLLVSVSALLALSLESEPLVTTHSASQVDDADSVKALLTQVSRSLRYKHSAHRLNITEAQLDSVVGMLQRASPQFSGDALVTEHAAELRVSLHVPPLFDRYLNAQIRLLPAQGIDIEYIKLGKLSIPGAWAVNLFAFAIDWYSHSDIGSQFTQQVEQVSLRGNSMQIKLKPLGEFLTELERVKQGMGPNGEKPFALEVSSYLVYLADLDLSQRTESQSLALYLQAVFAEAQRRSTADNAVEQNEAALVALASFVGHYRFATFVGAEQPYGGTKSKPLMPAMLAGRLDLNLHFIFSAAFKILSEQGLSFAIGEFKELMDRGNGGSGYSFIDLSADFAGVKLADLASQADTAGYVQQRLAANQAESVFFPSITGLPEGLSKQQFTQQFGGVDSPEYAAMVAEIHRRVDALPLYQQAPGK